MPDKEVDPLIPEIRKRFTYCQEKYRSIREEARIDMRFVAGDPWDPKERKSRADTNRPCLVFDELSQSINQLVNAVRQQKRSIVVKPAGEGATEKTAEGRQGIIRGIEYKSKAQVARETAFQSCCERSYGYYRVGTKYASDDGFEQDIVIRRIPNPDTIYLDPDAKEFDASDGEFAFATDWIRKDDFAQRFPNAEFKSFTPEMQTDAPEWLRDDQVQIAEYWKVEKQHRTLMLMDEQGTRAYLDEFKGAKLSGSNLILPNGTQQRILKSRKVETRKIVQYITNGVEILETNAWVGKWIPIIPIYGKEIFLTDESGSKRILLSLIRLARDPYMAYCWLRSNEAEEGAMSPKVPYLGYEGQFDGREAEWKLANKVPQPYLTVKATTEETGNQILPLPERVPFVPNFAAYELVIESVKRAIQSAMGRFNSAAVKADPAGRSGRAQQEQKLQSDEGSFHFIDNYERAMEHEGRIVNDLLDKIYDTKRLLATQKPDGSHEVIAVNDDDVAGQAESLVLDDSDHDVLISTGPSFQSQREEAADYINALVGTPLFPMVADLATKLKQLGPIGDEIAKRLTPPQFADQHSPEQMMGAIKESQQHLQAMNEYAKQLEAELQKLQQEKQAKVSEGQTKVELAKLQERTKIVVAMIAAKSKAASEVANQEAEKELAVLEDQAEMMSQEADHLHEHTVIQHTADVAPPPATQQAQA